MVWDLGKAMQKKEEFESARLMDFEFRQRARAMRLLAEELQLDGRELAGRTALAPDEAILADLVRQLGMDRTELAGMHASCRAEARKQLIAERGDPTPYRLG